MNYPEPAENPHCQCRHNPMRAFFCRTGHMLECHYPYDCRQAGCGHLTKYDFTPEEVAQLEAAALVEIRAGRRPPYVLDAQGHLVVRPRPANGKDGAP